MSTYKVIYDGKETTVEAVSARQAKLKGAFSYGLGGHEIDQFMRNTKVKVRRI